mgnify:CR=1 FL=1
MTTEILGIEGAKLEQKFLRYLRFSVLPWWREKTLRQISIGIVWYSILITLNFDISNKRAILRLVWKGFPSVLKIGIFRF